MSKRIQVTVNDLTYKQLARMAGFKGVELAKEGADILNFHCGSVDYDKRIEIAKKRASESISQPSE